MIWMFNVFNLVPMTITNGVQSYPMHMVSLVGRHGATLFNRLLEVELKVLCFTHIKGFSVVKQLHMEKKLKEQEERFTFEP